jgi:hypothetical protein
MTDVKVETEPSIPIKTLVATVALIAGLVGVAGGGGMSALVGGGATSAQLVAIQASVDKVATRLDVLAEKVDDRDARTQKIVDDHEERLREHAKAIEKLLKD